MISLTKLKKDDLPSILEKYKIRLKSNIKKKVKEVKQDVMVIDSTFSYEDGIGIPHVIKIHMYDLVKNGELPNKTDIRCFYDHHTFNCKPIGIPIEYVPHKMIHSYKTILNKKKVYVTKPSLELKDNGIEGNIYYTFGVCCSFRCALSYIRDNSHKEMFSESEYLLHNLYFDMTGKKNKLEPALDYLLLKDYNGDVDIDEWRMDKKSIILDTNTIISDIRQIPVGKLYEVNIRF